MSGSMEIPAEVVERAAHALWEHEQQIPWELGPLHELLVYRAKARAALVAARPYLMPTREEIGAALDPTAFVARKSDASYDQRRKLALQDADAVLDLLNGEIKKGEGGS